MSTAETPLSKSEPVQHHTQLTFSKGDKTGFIPAKNIFIAVTVPGIFPTEKMSTKFNCREHYEKQLFDVVDIYYNRENGLQIHAYKDNTMQELLVPERYILCVGVDYEHKQSK